MLCKAFVVICFSLHIFCKSELLDDLYSNIVERNVKFTNKVYSVLSKSGEVDMLFSPMGLFTMLSLMYMGSRGKTAVQIANALELPNDPVFVQKTFRRSMTPLHHLPHTYIKLANKIFVDSDITVHEKFRRIAYNNFDTNIQSVNFKSGNAEGIINKWISNRTEGDVKEHIWALNNDVLKRMVFINTAMFKAEWLHKFDPYATRESSFFTPTTILTVPMMYVLDYFKETKNTEVGARILQLPYKNTFKPVSFIIILPLDFRGLAALEERIRHIDLRNLTDMSDVASRPIAVSLPRFSVRDFVDTSRELAGELGLDGIFDAGSDFSGVSDSHLLLTRVFQEATLEVNEKGTMAAGATSMFAAPTNRKLVINYWLRRTSETMNVNHPFMFVIRDEDSGNILFVGKCSNPEAN